LVAENKSAASSSQSGLNRSLLKQRIKSEAYNISAEKLPRSNLTYIDEVFEQITETVLLSQKLFDKSIKLRKVVKKYVPRSMIMLLKKVKSKFLV
jgi:hypothetical protein